MKLAKKTATAVLWNFGEMLARRGIGIAVTLILAKLLTPEDFGIVAMMSVFLTIAISLMESGFRQALIRLPEINPSHYNTAFYANLALGAIAYGALYVAAPLVADFYQQQKLTALMRVASLVVILGSFQLVQVANLSRSLNFKAQMKIALPASAISGISAIAMAYFGFGVWSLIFQTLINELILAVLLWRVQRWHPARQFDFLIFKELYSFGYKVFFARSLDAIFKNIHVIVIAKVLTADIAGLYFLANQIKTLIVIQLVNSIQTVTFPAFAKIQKSKDDLREAYRKVLSCTTYCLFPVLTASMMVAPAFFKLYFDSEWQGAATYLQILCVVGLLHPLYSININIFKVLGRSDMYLRLTFLRNLIAGVVLAITASKGIYAILLGQLFSAAASTYINCLYSGRLINYTFRQQISDVMNPLALSLISGAVGYVIILVLGDISWTAILCALLGMAAVYLGASLMIRPLGYRILTKTASKMVLKR